MKAIRAGSLLAVAACVLALLGCSNAVAPGDTTHVAVDPAHATIGLLLGIAGKFSIGVVMIILFAADVILRSVNH